MKKISILFVILTAINAWPQSGNLNTTFGTNGKVHTGFGVSNSKANAVAA